MHADGGMCDRILLPAKQIYKCAKLTPVQIPLVETLGVGIHAVGRAAVGSGLIRIDGAAKAQARAIEQLRRSASFGNIVLRRGSPQLKSLVDVWDGLGDRQRLFASLKRAFDPQGILSPGRGPV